MQLTTRGNKRLLCDREQAVEANTERADLLLVRVTLSDLLQPIPILVSEYITVVLESPLMYLYQESIELH